MINFKDQEILERLFHMKGGYVLDFSNNTFQAFFQSELGINIYDEKYVHLSGSKANMLRGFWNTENNKMIGKSIIKLVEYIEYKIILGDFDSDYCPRDRINMGASIGKRLLGDVHEGDLDEGFVMSEANFSGTDNVISITLQKEVFNHVKSLLKSGHYFNAVEESYKIVREKLKITTGKEKAHEAFKEENYEIIFGHKPKSDAEKDFFEGVKFLHMAIQNLRNEKAHTPAKEIDKNLAIHYIVLVSLAYDLINRDNYIL